MHIIKNRKIYFTISSVLVVASLFSIIYFGIPLGIDFTGGSLVEVSYSNFEINDSNYLLFEENLDKLNIGKAILQITDSNGLIVRMPALSENEHLQVIYILSKDGSIELEEKRFTSIGPVIGEELKEKAVIAIILVIITIIIFISFVFRQVSRPVSSWKYGIVAIVALAHDIIIPTGLIAILGYFVGAHIDALFITALLAILGLSVNDTIVVFDRIRENLKLKVSDNFSETVGISLKQTITRSINTSVTTLFVLLALLFFGPESTRTFALILSVGLIAGTYSSIFLASPLLVVFAKNK